MAHHAHRIISLDVVARGARFNIFSRQFGMQPAARTPAQDRKPCLLMRERFYFHLRDIAACIVALCTE
jgi:hypothetical protein